MPDGGGTLDCCSARIDVKMHNAVIREEKRPAQHQE